MRCSACGFALMALGMAEAAFAQTTTTATPTVTLNMQAVRRSNAQHTVNPLWISEADCEAGDEYTFPLTTSYNQSGITYTFEVWVGSNCADKAARGITSGVPTCGRVYRTTAPGQPTATIKLSNAIMLGALSATGQNATVQPRCTVPSNFVGTQVLTVFFMFVDGNGESYSAQSTVGINFNLSGPTAPTDVTGEGVDKMVKLSWPPNTDSKVAGYYVYCDPPPGHESDSKLSLLSGSRDCGEPSTSTTPSVNCDCPPSSLIPGQKPDTSFHLAHKCGQADGYATSSVNITGLLNGYSYNFAVAAFDKIGNRGILSTVGCASPEPGNDQYSEASLCSVHTPNRKASGFTALVALGSMMALRALRRRKKGAAA